MGLKTIADHILDIAQNSVEAGASNIELEITEDEERFVFTVEDDGRGMDEETLKMALDPFYSSKTVRRKRVGLGLPFLKQAVEATGGEFCITSELGRGTRVKAEFFLNHVDCQPVGDLVGSLVTLLSTPNVRIVVRRVKGEKGYEVDNRKLDLLLGEGWEIDPIRLKALYNMLDELERTLVEPGEDGVS